MLITVLRINEQFFSKVSLRAKTWNEQKAKRSLKHRKLLLKNHENYVVEATERQSSVLKQILLNIIQSNILLRYIYHIFSQF